MLVLSRKCRESVIVGGSNGFERLVTVTVLEISGTRVKLGFNVPKDVPVHRLELWERLEVDASGNGNQKPLQDSQQDVAHGIAGEG